MVELVDFSGNANVYDRRHGALLGDVLQRLAAAADLQPGVRLLDIGAGTGRVAVPLAGLGCEVVALEPATGMVKELRRKAGATNVRVISGEGAHLPFGPARFGAVVIARVLYLTPAWRDVLREASSVLAPGGRLLHEWANGETDEPWVQIREKARALFEQAGIDAPFHPGVRSEREVDEWLGTLGFARTAILSTGPGPSLTLAEFLRRLIDGEFSYIWKVPKHVQEECLPRLQSWAKHTFNLDETVSIPQELHWAVYRKDAL